MPDAPKHRYWGRNQPEPITAVLAEATGKTAVMRIFDPIDSWGAPFGVSAKDFSAALDSLDDSVDTIELHLHSPGGDAFEGIAILNALRQHPAKVNVIVDGLAASAASVVAMAGDTVSMAPSSELMVHDASALVIGQATDLKTAAAMLDSVSDSYAAAYAAKAGGTVADWRSAMQPETWFKADEAVAAGLADEVLADAPPRPKTRFDLSIFAHAGRDHAPAPVVPSKASHKPPAEPPVKPPTTEEAVTMTDTEIKALRERLGLAEDADIGAINAKLDELEEAATTPGDKPDVTDEAVAKAWNMTPEQIKAAREAKPTEPVIPDGKLLVDAAQWEDVKSQAALGAEVHAQRLNEDRDKVIDQAFRDGKISAALKPRLVADWDADVKAHGNADLTRQRIADMAVIYPVQAASSGYIGSQDSITSEDELYAQLFPGEKAGV